MEAREWEREIEVDGTRYVARFIKRPFREGIEVRVELSEETISIAEMGLGEQALLERVRTSISKKIEKTAPLDVVDRKQCKL